MLLPGYSEETRDLLCATTLIQTIGLFHEDVTERQNSHLFHSMLLVVCANLLIRLSGHC